jgi:hypothetical protein
MAHPDDIGHCARCGRWQRRRYAYVEEFGPDDREEWCVTGNCLATWSNGVELALSGVHTDGDGCMCASCLPATTDVASMERAARQGLSSLDATS